MKIALTGAAGVLSREIASQLADRDVELRLTDVLPMDDAGGHDFIQADLAVAEQARAAVDGVDVVIHVAAIHPWKEYTSDQYLDCNVKAVHHVLQACVDAGVPRVIYTSSIAAAGYNRDVDELPLTEHIDRRPNDLYGASKAMGETLCETFSRTHGLHVISLRPPCFIPTDETDPSYGVRLLSTHGHVTDVAQAHVKALDRPDLRCDAFWCTSAHPFTREDVQELQDAPRSVYARHFREAEEFIMSRPELEAPLGLIYDLSRAREKLGYTPKTGFASWFAANA
ncbi:MAG TPA: NAD(P)-dependent oxidoreductase [Armatimonadota bacterium]|nr:NAD(P)-dependent oxidoreductase [Armatimonadota bacterium]